MQLSKINLSKLHKAEELQQLDQACRTAGIFELVEHGMDSVGEDLLSAAADLFALPRDSKRKFERTADNAWGYFDRELTKNQLDCKEIFDFGTAAAGWEPQWPEDLPQFRTAVLAAYEACEEVARKLLGALAENFGVAPKELEADFGSAHTSFLRLNHYDPENDVSDLGVGQHTDSGALTLLFTDAEPGLEVWQGDAWQRVAAPSHAVLVNLGDIAQVWSNDQYHAPLHRVARPERTRFTAPFFYNPAYTATYAPLAGMLDDGEPKYSSINWGEFREKRAAGDFADYGSEVQISDYAL